MCIGDWTAIFNTMGPYFIRNSPAHARMFLNYDARAKEIKSLLDEALAAVTETCMDGRDVYQEHPMVKSFGQVESSNPLGISNTMFKGSVAEWITEVQGGKGKRRSYR